MGWAIQSEAYAVHLNEGWDILFEDSAATLQRQKIEQQLLKISLLCRAST